MKIIMIILSVYNKYFFALLEALSFWKMMKCLYARVVKCNVCVTNVVLLFVLFFIFESE